MVSKTKLPIVSWALCTAMLCALAQCTRMDITMALHAHSAIQDDDNPCEGPRIPAFSVNASLSLDAYTKQSTDTCKSCLKIKGCKWCSLTQNCKKSGLTSGAHCKKSSELGMHWLTMQGMTREDEKVKRESDCGKKPVPWMLLMERAYGRSWRSDGHKDAVQCLQWSLNMPVDPNSNSKDPHDHDAVGRWGCKSALLRDGILSMLGKSLAGSQGLKMGGEQGTVSLMEMGAAADLENHSVSSYQGDSLSTEEEANGIWAKVTTWKSPLCSMIQISLKDDVCEVSAHEIQAFSELWKRAAQPNGLGSDVDRALAASIEQGPLITQDPGAGKSGSGFASTADGKFMVKLGLKESIKMHEPGNLLKLLKGLGSRSTTLAGHLMDNPDSQLNRYYGLLNLKFAGQSIYVLVMADASYGTKPAMQAAAQEGKVDYTVYDLKGKSRDQSERAKEGKETKINGDFSYKERNRMFLDDAQCLKLRRAVEKDAKFLGAHWMIDYSFLLTVTKASGNNSAPGCEGTPGEPFCFHTRRYTYTVSTIDHVNNLNWAKKGESILITPGKMFSYGAKYLKYVQKICRTRDEISMMEHVNRILRQGFETVEKAFAHADEDGNGLIDRNEFGAFLQELAQLGLTSVERSQLFEEIDKDGSGMIDINEFRFVFM